MNKHIKSVVKTNKGIPKSATVHKFIWKDDLVTVGEDGDVVPTGAFRYPITRRRM